MSNSTSGRRPLATALLVAVTACSSWQTSTAFISPLQQIHLRTATTSRPQPSSQAATTARRVLSRHGVDERNAASKQEETVAPSTNLENKIEIANPEKLLLPALGFLATAGLTTFATTQGWSVNDVVHAVEAFVANPQATFQMVLDNVEAMGPAAPFYFGILYLAAELLAVPATPLTMSAGYLFGVPQGTVVVLTAATIAASISFVIGKTFLRSWVESVLQEQDKFAKLDKAIGEQGFKLLLLVRLSPIFPFALSNYLYGASSISFPAYFWGTLLGFAPGTLAYVYTGMVGKELLLGGSEGSQPWYMYAAGFGVLLTFLKLVTDVATGIVEAIDDDDKNSGAGVDNNDTVVSP